MSEINKKGKLKQLFCKHKNTGWYTKYSTYQSLRGEMQYEICGDCGKELNERLFEYEGMGFK